MNLKEEYKEKIIMEGCFRKDCCYSTNGAG